MLHAISLQSMNRILVRFALITLALLLASCNLARSTGENLVRQEGRDSYIPKARPHARLPDIEMIKIASDFMMRRIGPPGTYSAASKPSPIVLMGRLFWSIHFEGLAVSCSNGASLSICGDDVTVLIEDSNGVPRLFSEM